MIGSGRRAHAADLMPPTAERRVEPRLPTEEVAQVVIASTEHPAHAPTRIDARLVDRSRSGCCIALERLRLESLHLLDCLEDPASFRIEVTLPNPRKSEPARAARVVWINRVFEGPGPAFRVGLALGNPA